MKPFLVNNLVTEAKAMEYFLGAFAHILVPTTSRGGGMAGLGIGCNILHVWNWEWIEHLFGDSLRLKIELEQWKFT